MMRVLLMERLLVLAIVAVFTVIAGFIPQVALAGYDGHVGVQPRSRIKIAIRSIYDQVPTNGFFPIEISIKNGTKSAQTWVLETTSSSPGTSGNLQYFKDLTVEGGQSRKFLVYAPLLNVAPVSGGMPWGNAKLTGYGVVSSSFNFQGGKYGSSHTPYTLMGKALALNSWKKIEDALSKKHRMLRGSAIEPASLLTDWRAYAGVSSVWLTLREWEGLSKLQRDALKNWIYAGGHLHIGAEQELTSIIGFSDIRPPKEAYLYGMGTVQQFVTPTQDDIDTEYFQLNSRSEETPLPSIDEVSAWTLARALLENRVPVGMLVLLMCVYALIVGPVNIIQFTNSYTRHRLFWTTPIIAAVTTVIIAFVIYFRDGIGGDGNRIGFILLKPDTNQSLLLQEQVSRTGLIFSDKFKFSDPAQMFLIKNFSWRDKVSVVQNENSVSGSFFQNRSLQKHFIKSYLPTRSRISLDIDVNGVASRTSQNELGVPLKRLFYVDAERDVWKASNVGVGQRVVMTRSGVGELKHDLRDVQNRAGSEIRHALLYATAQSDIYIGITEQPGDMLFDSLDSIRWKNDLTVIVSPGVSRVLEG